jgi:hypothetical protein
MKIILSLAKSGSIERWDALPYVSWDKAKQGKEFKATGKKKSRKVKRRGLIDTPLKGAERTISTVADRPKEE